jgi:hypothetical protein
LFAICEKKAPDGPPGRGGYHPRLRRFEWRPHAAGPGGVSTQGRMSIQNDNHGGGA